MRNNLAIVSVIFVCLTMCFLSGKAVAGDLADADFAFFDTDSSGEIVREEFVNGVKITTFRELDKDGNEVIQWSEWEIADSGPESREHFNLMDKNKDGKISMPEFSDAINRYSDAGERYRAMDVDGSGTVTVDEFNRRPGLNLFSGRF